MGSAQLGHRPPARLRLRTHPPLRPLQAWVPFIPSSSIVDLKTSILHLLASCQSVPLTAQDIVLELDGFAFLDQSPCSMIDAAHDLIDVKTLVPTPSPSQEMTSKKRSRAQSKFNADPSALPAQTTTEPLQPSTSQSVADKPQLANARTIKPLPASRANEPPAVQDSGIKKPQAPPGQGKASTKARNKRKRLKKMYERQQKPAAPENTAAVPASEQGLAKLINSGQEHAGSSVVAKKARVLAKGQDGPSQSTQKDIQVGKPSSSQSSSGEDSTGSSTHDSQSSASDSDSDSAESSNSDSGTSSSPSDSRSGSSNSASSAPSSASIRPPTAPTSALVVPKTVPMTHDPQLNMLSLSNKNKRKNLKRGPYAGAAAQPSKIVFHPSLRSPRPPSPTYEPPSPSRSNWSDCEPTAAGGVGTTHAASGGVEDGQATADLADDSLLTPASRSHGPPPSMRPAKLIPPNMVITSVDVLDPSWEAGQIGHRPSAAHPLTNRKNRERNRKKNAKRRRRAANSQRLNAGPRSAEESGGETELDDEGHDDVEEAFTEFMSAGGHKATMVEMDAEQEDGKKDEMERITGRWEELEKVDESTAVVGERIAIKTIGLCLETFTPETVVYYGTLLASDSTHLTLNLDPGCHPDSKSVELECDGGWDSEQMDTKEAMRAQQRDALRQDAWGDERGSREWTWCEVADARKI